MTQRQRILDEVYAALRRELGWHIDDPADDTRRHEVICKHRVLAVIDDLRQEKH